MLPVAQAGQEDPWPPVPLPAVLPSFPASTPSTSEFGPVVLADDPCLAVSCGADPDFAIKAFTGREWDPEIGLYYYRARYYDPADGRFLSEDPIPEQAREFRELNAYAYVANNPVNNTDPLGLSIFETCAGRVKREVDAKYCSKNAPNQAPDDPSCREAHCIANCRITRECFGGRATAYAASKWKEFSDTWDPTSGSGWDPGDQAANRKGRICGSAPQARGWTCEKLCEGSR